MTHVGRHKPANSEGLCRHGYAVLTSWCSIRSPFVTGDAFMMAPRARDRRMIRGGAGGLGIVTVWMFAATDWRPPTIGRGALTARRAIGQDPMDTETV
jgi:hypothetical protein